MKLQLAIILMTVLFLQACKQAESSRVQEVSTFVPELFGGTGGLTTGPDGNIYVSDFGPILGGIRNLKPLNRVFKIDSTGKVEVFATGFYGASGSKFDKNGNFYQSNVRRGFVTKISADGNRDSVFIDQLKSPVGISLDSAENLYINNCDAHKIVRVDQNGTKTDFCTDTLLNCPNGLTSDDNGNFYASNFYDGNVVKISPDGKASLFTTIPGNNNGHILYHDQFLYVIARTAHQIYRISLNGEITLFAGTGERGSRNGKKMESRFSYPNDLDVSLDGRFMYVNEIVDTISDHRVLTPMRVRRISLE